MELPEREQRLWARIRAQRGEHGVPLAVCSTLTPFPFWVVVGSMIVLIPLALVVSFFVRRQAILVQGGEIVVLDLSFWRYTVREELIRIPVAGGGVELDGNALAIGGTRFHLEPGWRESAERIRDFADGSAR